MIAPFLAGLSPNLAVVGLTAGAALVAIELNRPGLVFAGAGGLLLVLLSAAALLTRGPHLWAVALLVFGAVTLLLQLRRTLPAWASAVASAALFAGFLYLLPGRPIQPALAAVCAMILGSGTTLLTRIARRARTNKGLD